ncbi:MAG: hypothetical protein AB1439_12405 [candidate division FCPU426 bacterium]
MKKTLLNIAGGFCLAMLFAPVCWQPWRNPNEEWFIQKVEKRQLARWPRIVTVWDLLKTRTYSEVNQALQDRLPFRGLLIIIKNRLAYYLLNERLFGDVVVGPTRWFFIRSAYYRPWEEAKTRRVLKMMEHFLGRQPGLKPGLRIFIPPDKDMIYPEKLRARDRALADRYHRRRTQIHNFFTDHERQGVWGLTRAYQMARSRNRGPVFLTFDTHHTYQGRMMMLKTMVEALHPGLWRDSEVAARGRIDVYGDLPLLSGIGPVAEKDTALQLRRRDVRCLKQEWLQSEKTWRAPVHYVYHSDTQQFIPGKSLVIYDSMLGNYRRYLAEYFQDAVFVHYNTLLEDVFLAGQFSDFDRMVIEVGDRQVVASMAELFTRLNARAVCELDPVTLKYQDSNRTLQPEKTAQGVKCDFRSYDPMVYLPRTALPMNQDYILQIEFNSSVATSGQLFYREAPGQGYGEDRSFFKDIRRGRNSLVFPLNAKQLSYPMRFDPLCQPGTILLQSAQVFAIDPPPSLGAASIMADVPAASDASRLWILAETGPERRIVGGMDAVLTANKDAQLQSLARGLWIGASNPDPSLQLPSLAAAADARPVLELALESSEDTWAQVYFRLASDQAFAEERSLRRHVRPGMNRLRFRVSPESLGGGLRLDPGGQSGLYLIKELAVSNLRGSGKSREAGAPDRLRLIYPVTSWYELSGKELARIQGNAEARLTCTEEGLELAVTGTDPQLYLPRVQGQGTTAGVLRLVLESDRKTSAQLFFTTQPGEGYSEENSSSRDLKPGRNEMYFNLARGALDRPLRLDPACHAGKYLIRSLKLGLVGGAEQALSLDWSREYCENLSAAALEEVFTYQCSETLSHWDAPGLLRRTGNGRAQWALPVPPGLSGKYLFRLTRTGSATGACRLYYSKDRQNGYNEEHFLCQTTRQGVAEYFFYLEGTQLQQALLLDLEPAAGNTVRLELRELLESPGSLEPTSIAGY